MAHILSPTYILQLININNKNSSKKKSQKLFNIHSMSIEISLYYINYSNHSNVIFYTFLLIFPTPLFVKLVSLMSRLKIPQTLCPY